MSQVTDANDPDGRKKKYSNWRDAAYDKTIVNTNTSWRTNSNKPLDVDQTFKLLSTIDSNNKLESDSQQERYYEGIRKSRRNWRLQQ